MTKRSSSQSRARGFTLLELVVAISLSALVITAVVGLMVTGYSDRLRASKRAEFAREGIFVTQRLTDDLRSAGLGVPAGARLTGGANFYASVLAGSNGPGTLGVVGDIARPHATYNTFGNLHTRPPTSDNLRTLAWHTENNGSCIARADESDCQVGETSTWFPDNGGLECNSYDALHCPWSMRRVEDGDELWIVDGIGRWEVRNFDDASFGYRPFATMQVSADWPGAWANAAAGDGPGGNGQGWVTTLDRVYWRHDDVNSKLLRNHCWGEPGAINTATWPEETTAAAPIAPAGSGIGKCTGWVPMMENVTAVTFEFRDRLNNPLDLSVAGNKALVARIDFRIQLFVQIHGEDVTHDVYGSVAIRN